MLSLWKLSSKSVIADVYRGFLAKGEEFRELKLT